MLYAGKESAVVGLVDLSQIVREMTELLKISASKHAVLEVNLGENLPSVKADPAQLRQIVMNLVTNASEAIGNRRGMIRVTTRYVKVRRGSSAATTAELAETDHLELEVSDTGRGMSLETQAKAFDPFFTTKSAGRGLGLAIVAGIVRSLRGQIHVTSDLGKGTKFQISLPCEAETSTDLTSSGAQAGRCSGRPTILVVEDEDALRHAAAKMLRTSGFDVIEAADGSIAIDALRATGSKIDVILLDLTIPGPSSRDVAAEYMRVRPDAKVILTSAYSEDLVRAIMVMPEIRSFIRKPYHLTDLVKTLQDALS
jgi:CheY-like chemotaxis protein